MLVISGGKIITMGPQGTLQSKIIIVEGDRIKAITEADDVLTTLSIWMLVEDIFFPALSMPMRILVWMRRYTGRR